MCVAVKHVYASIPVNQLAKVQSAKVPVAFKYVNIHYLEESYLEYI